MIKILIPIQSISDIITNSSSEIFAYIHSKNHLDKIYSWINIIFEIQESEITPCVHLRNKKERDYWFYDQTEEFINSFPEQWIEIELPYSYYDVETFYKEGLKALLDKKIGSKNYVIVYNRK